MIIHLLHLILGISPFKLPNQAHYKDSCWKATKNDNEANSQKSIWIHQVKVHSCLLSMGFRISPHLQNVKKKRWSSSSLILRKPLIRSNIRQFWKSLSIKALEKDGWVGLEIY
jgi:hypothetical protein